MTISPRDIAITIGITVIIAIIITFVFLIISGQKQDKQQDGQTQELIDQIKQQASENDKDEVDIDDDKDKDDDEIQEKTFTGVLESIDNDLLLVADNATDELIRVILTNDTNITYNGKKFNKADFYNGDQLQILATPSKDHGWEALNIVVRFSASPKTEAPVPQGLEERPDGTLKPIGN
ncbi:hypothetical protein KKF64_02240 [Patescibacteria group bacterium]|nr:hypothetical protein [Patescibacteria group bacterium]